MMFNREDWNGSSLVVVLAMALFLIIFMTGIVFRCIFPLPVKASNEYKGPTVYIRDGGVRATYENVEKLDIDHGLITFRYHGKWVYVLSGIVEIGR